MDYKYRKEEKRRMFEKLQELYRNPEESEEEIRIYLEKRLDLKPHSLKIGLFSGKKENNDLLEDFDEIDDETFKRIVNSSLDIIPIDEDVKDKIRNMDVDTIREIFRYIRGGDKEELIGISIEPSPSLRTDIGTIKNIGRKADKLLIEYLLGDIKTTKMAEYKIDKKRYTIKECPYDKGTFEEIEKVDLKEIEKLEHLKGDYLFNLIRRLSIDNNYAALFLGSDEEPLVYENEEGYGFLTEKSKVPISMGTIKKSPKDFVVKLSKNGTSGFSIEASYSQKCRGCDKTDECAMNGLYYDIIKE